MRRTFRTAQELQTLLAVASSREPADLYLDGATLLNVYSGELYPANVAVKGRRIAYVGRSHSMVGPETRVLRLDGKILAPGYVEPHTHITGLATPEEFAREVVRTGTTTLVADTLQILLHTPADRIPRLLALLGDMPVLVVWFLRLHAASYLPDESMFAADRIRPLLEIDTVRAVGEVTRWPAVYYGDEDLLQKIAMALASGRRVEGHAPGTSYERLVALAAAGWSSDHEAITPEEITNRLRAGIYTMLRHSSLRPDLPLLAPSITDDRARSGRLMLTADGPEAVTIVDHGYLSHVIRQAIASGVPPVLAYQMATINPAAYFGLDEEIGGIGPGRRADIVVLDDLCNPTPELVVARGEIAVRDGEVQAKFPTLDWGSFFAPRFQPSWDPQPALFEMPAAGAAGRSSATDTGVGMVAGRTEVVRDAVVCFPVIHLENSVITSRVDTPMPVRDGLVHPPPEVLRLALIDPRGRWIVRGALANFVTRLGGLASSFDVVAQMVVLGQAPADMARAAQRVLEIGGGIVIVEGGEVMLEIPLPIGGIMNSEPLSVIAAMARRLYAFLRERGYPHTDPHYTLLFLSLDSLPDIRITYRGVWDVRRRKVLVPRQEL